jgi:hypothetical protein
MAFEPVEETQVEMFKCWICNDAEFDSKQKLGAHQPHCKLKNPNYKERTNRVPVGVPTQRFTVPQNDGYEYRVFNDNWKKEPGRIQRASVGGWELWEHERSGDAVSTNDDGSEVRGVLMRIPKELYDEDQASKNEEMDKVDKQIQRGKFQAGGALEGSTYKPS